MILALVLFQLLTVQYYFSKITPKATQRIIKLMLFTNFVLWLFSFYRCSYAQAATIPQYAMNQVAQDQWCTKSNSWKPERADYCEVSRRVILKYQGYKTLVANSIGFHNEKFFFLTCAYGGVLSVLYLESALRYYLSTSQFGLFDIIQAHIGILSILLMIYYISSLTTMFLRFWNNVTGKEKEKGFPMKLPGCPRNLEKLENIQKHRNPYDRLWLTNLCDIFGSSFWIWPLPIRSSLFGNGFCYPKIPELNLRDIIEAEESNKVGETIAEIEGDESYDDLKEYYDDLGSFYSGKHLFFYTMRFDM